MRDATVASRKYDSALITCRPTSQSCLGSSLALEPVLPDAPCPICFGLGQRPSGQFLQVLGLILVLGYLFDCGNGVEQPAPPGFADVAERRSLDETEGGVKVFFALVTAGLTTILKASEQVRVDEHIADGDR